MEYVELEIRENNNIRNKIINSVNNLGYLQN